MTWRTGGAGIVLAGLALGGCGGGTSGPNPPPPPPPGPPVVTTVSVTSPNADLFIEDTVQVTAVVKDQNGAPMTGKRVTWNSDKPNVATIDTTGRVIALAPGGVTITASAEGKSGTASLTVVGPGTQGAVSGSALVGPAGGSVGATLPGGGTLALTVPAGALADPVTITLEPIVPQPGSLAAFRMSPAGQVLAVPATLVIRVSAGAKVRPTTTLVFDDGNGPVPAPGTPNVTAGTVTVSLSSLGLPVSSAPAPRAAAQLAPGGGGSSLANVMSLSLAQRIAYADSALQHLQRQGTVAAAGGMQFAMDAVVMLDPTAGPLLTSRVFSWTAAVCGFTEFARNAFNSFGFISDYEGFERVTGDYLGWSLAMDAMRDFQAQFTNSPSCPNTVPNPQTEIETRFLALKNAFTADLNGFVLTPSPRDSVFFQDRIGPLLNLNAALRLANFDPAADVLGDIVTNQVDRVRAGGYGECKTNPGSQEIQSRLVRALSTHGVLSAVASFDEFDLEKDIELCGMDILWKLKDSTAAITASGRLGMSSFTGVRSTGSGAVPGEGILEIGGGLLRSLQCPSPASANLEQLEFLAGPDAFTLTRVAVLSPSNQNDYLAVSSLQLSAATLRSAAGLPAGAFGTVVVVIQRIGGVCSGLFANLAHSPIGTLTVTLADPCFFPAGPAGAPASGGANVCQQVQIVEAPIPNGFVGVNYSNQLSATGGTAPHQWSIAGGGLPPGLSLSGATGVISGIPTAEGVFPFKARVVSGTLQDDANFVITIGPAIGDKFLGTADPNGPVPAAAAGLIFSPSKDRVLYCHSATLIGVPNANSAACATLPGMPANVGGEVFTLTAQAGGHFFGPEVAPLGQSADAFIQVTITGNQLTGQRTVGLGLTALLMTKVP